MKKAQVWRRHKIRGCDLKKGKDDIEEGKKSLNMMKRREGILTAALCRMLGWDQIEKIMRFFSPLLSVLG